MNIEVEKYYDRNTSRFLKYDHYETYGIHREVWGNGVATAEDAFNFVNSLILDIIQKHQPESIIDLGCGVGGSLFYLAQSYSKACYYGITISSAQVEISKKINKRLNLKSDCLISKGDFQNLDRDIPLMDLAYSVEAFVHATDSHAFFREISNKMNKNGFLIICDDFLTDNLPADSSEKKLIEFFRKGWVLGSLMSTKSAEDIASKYGYKLIENIDLTPNLKLRRSRDILISLYVIFLKPFMEFSLYIKALVGGDALQKCLMKELVQYRFLVFQKI
ncbi:class I SAM-dependent methyltransferase [Microcoleus sp. A2-C5]|uniref:SAM-dependent methyltransferase n=1 Tax=unclassified Microcoleus TaxID=2642155 RepID=UPI002FD496DE